MQHATTTRRRHAGQVTRILLGLLVTAVAAFGIQGTAAADDAAQPAGAAQKAAVGLAGPDKAAAPDQGFVPASEMSATAWNCDPHGTGSPSGYVCFYQNTGGTGYYCYTNYSNTSWSKPGCSSTTYRSYFNNGFSGSGVQDHVYSYVNRNHSGRNGCYHVGAAEGRGNMSAKYIRSVRWFDGEC